jgi:hypothetical protein
MLLNNVGIPLIKKLESENLEANNSNIENFIADSIQNINDYSSKLKIKIDKIVRDDKIGSDLEKLLDNDYSTLIYKKDFIAKFCPKCQRILGPDPTIHTCKWCGSKTEDRKDEGVFIKADINEIKKKIDKIKYYPPWTKTQISDFADSLPKIYDLLISKTRQYTLSIGIDGKKVDLDPRFVTLMTVPLIYQAERKDKNNKNLVIIHGRAPKKFDYYNICYSKDYDLPNIVISHGTCLGPSGKKIKSDSIDTDVDLLIDKYSPSILRGFLLTRNIDEDIRVSEQRIMEVRIFKNRLDNVLLKLKENLREDVIAKEYNELNKKVDKLYALAMDLKLSEFFAEASTLLKKISSDYIKQLGRNYSSDKRLLSLIEGINHLYFSE